MNVILGADAIRYPLTGIGRYVHELACGLSRSNEVDSLRYLINGRLGGTLPASMDDARRGESAASLRETFLKSRFAISAYRFFMPIAQRVALRRCGKAVYHGPNYYLPPHTGPCVATFHDLSVFKYPECHPPERIRYMHAELSVALRRASVLIADSEFSRQELIEFSRFSADRVVAIPLASSSEFFPRTVLECAATLRKYGIDYKEYCLFAGTIEPRKNLSGLLDAYQRLPQRLRLAMPLVVTGYRGWRSEVLHQRLKDAQQAGWVKYLGFVSAHDLPVLFAGAKTFVFPSFYEGFGLPVIEAMASGVPVICSSAASLPEVAGNAALICEAEDVPGLTRLLERAVEDSEWRTAAALSGIMQASRFSWGKTVASTIETYRAVLDT